MNLNKKEKGKTVGKKIIGAGFAIAFVAMLALSAIPMTLGENVSAEENNDPLFITTAEELYALGASGGHNGEWGADKHYYLGNDIVLPATMNGAEFQPIGTKAVPFRGTFDGDYYKISGLRLTTPRENMGLFGYTYGATITCIILKDFEINIKSDSSIHPYIGALVSFLDGNGNLSRCQSIGKITVEIPNAEYVAIGGLVAKSGNMFIPSLVPLIDRCYNATSINLINNLKNNIQVAVIGGIVSDSFGKIEQCANVGELKGNCSIVDVGGITGGHSTGKISNCYNTGHIVGLRVAGIAPSLFGEMDKNIIENCYNSGKLENIKSKIYKPRSFAIADSDGVIINSYYLKGTIKNPGDGTARERSSKQMQDISTYVNWKFGGIWDINNRVNNGYPTLAQMNPANGPDVPFYILLDLSISGDGKVEYSINGGNFVRYDGPVSIESGSKVALRTVDGEDGFKRWSGTQYSNDSALTITDATDSIVLNAEFEDNSLEASTLLLFSIVGIVAVSAIMLIWRKG